MRTKTREERISQIRNQTKDDVLYKLGKYGKCLIIRPTGYGKTYLLTDLIARYDKVLYLYPSAVVGQTVFARYTDAHEDEFDDETLNFINIMSKQETFDTVKALSIFDNIKMMTYAKFVRTNTSNIKSENYDCIIVDEAHLIGAEKTKIALSNLLRALPNADFIGATATPNRTNGFDVASIFFDNILTFSYSYHDAVTDGMLQKLNYYYCTYDLKTSLKEKALMAGQDINNPVVIETYNKKLIELSHILSMDNIIKTVCDNFAQNTNYMKFVVFFGNTAHLRQKLTDVEGWFKSAYPNHNIKSLVIYSSDAVKKKNVHKLATLKPKDNTIHLIACVDMLNLGYHVNDLTGIVMYRATKSDIIYIQQLGRALSSGSDTESIVFDVVDNLHRKAVYLLNDKLGNSISPIKRKKPKRRSSKTPVGQTPWTYDAATNKMLDEFGNEAPFVIDNEKIYDMKGNHISSLYIDAVDHKVYAHVNDIDNSTVITANDVNRLDTSIKFITATGHEATQAELLAKIEAEPLWHRCRIAVVMHFKCWCHHNGIDYPLSKQDFDMLGGFQNEDFVKYMKDLIKKRKLNYNLQDANWLLSYGEDDSINVPMSVCAKANDVTMRDIVNLLMAK